MPKLVSHRYGKARVRVMKILRKGAVHRLRDIEVAALLEGDFAPSYTSGDNTKVVPTDTIKNTIDVLAKQHLGDEIEHFAILLGEYFLKKYSQVRVARIEIHESDWRRMEIEGKPHSHSFVRGGGSKMFTRVMSSPVAPFLKLLERGISLFIGIEDGDLHKGCWILANPPGNRLIRTKSRERYGQPLAC